jgi:hypothetical protein
MKTKNMTTPDLRKSIGRPPLRRSFLSTVFALALTWLALSPQARAACQQGCDATNGNTFLGDDALINNTTGGSNTATGHLALLTNTTGGNNTATGFQALYSNTTGTYNTATGFDALNHNTSGNDNTATGNDALTLNSTGGNNTATGFQALVNNTTGSENTAIGWAALGNNTTGSGNIALGVSAGHFTNGNSNIDIGNGGVGGESKHIRIGTAGVQTKTFIAGISGATVANGVGVIVGSNGQLGTVVSSERFKDKIKPMDKASEAILGLKPVTFRYKHELDPDGIPQFGLVAEEVEKVNPDLVARDDQGKVYTVRYEAVNAMLLNEFLKEHRKVEEQTATISAVKSAAANRDEKITRLESTIAEQQKQIASLTESLKQQAAEVRKVSTRLETERSTPRLIADK